MSGFSALSANEYHQFDPVYSNLFAILLRHLVKLTNAQNAIWQSLPKSTIPKTLTKCKTDSLDTTLPLRRDKAQLIHRPLALTASRQISYWPLLRREVGINTRGAFLASIPKQKRADPLDYYKPSNNRAHADPTAIDLSPEGTRRQNDGKRRGVTLLARCDVHAIRSGGGSLCIVRCSASHPDHRHLLIKSSSTRKSRYYHAPANHIVVSISGSCESIRGLGCLLEAPGRSSALQPMK
jgi:hypothetical protein